MHRRPKAYWSGEVLVLYGTWKLTRYGCRNNALDLDYPLVKCPGTDNPADMMTKYLGAKESWKYVAKLYMEERQGRAAAAAQLHNIRELVLSRSTAGTAANPDMPVIVYPNGDQGRDVWECRGEGGVWRRRHRKQRLSLFTPYRVPRGPAKGAKLAVRRTTTGTFHDGEAFSFEDEWNVSDNQHKLLDRAWTGYTEFHIEEA